MTVAGEKKTSGVSQRFRKPLKSPLPTRPPPTSVSGAAPKAAVALERKKVHVKRRRCPVDKIHEKVGDSGSAFASSEEPGGSNGQQKVGVDDKAQLAELERTLLAVRQERHSLQEHLGILQETRMYDQTHLESTDRDPEPASPRRPRPDQIGHGPDSSLCPSFSKPGKDTAEQNSALRAKVAELQAKLAEKDALHERWEQHMHNRDVELNELRGRLHHAEKESQERLQQLLDLKHSISALTRTDSQITDSELAERADQLYHRIREFVVNNFRRAKIGFNNVSPDMIKSLEAIYPRWRMASSCERLAFFQSVIGSLLMSIFNENLCVGLPTSGTLAPLRTVADCIRGAGNDYREWRNAMIKAMEKSEVRHALQQGRADLVHRMAGDIERHLLTSTSVGLTSHARSSLHGIIQAAADLQQTLLLQRAQYRLHFFRHQEAVEQGVAFYEDLMESVNDIDDVDEDGHVMGGRKFAFCLFPCLEKIGDETGEKLKVRTVLLRAKVCSHVG